jgi:hypothetical protein
VNEWNQLVFNLESVAGTVNSQNEGDLKFRQVLAKTVLDIQGNVNGTEVKIQLLLARMGRDPDPLEGGSVNLWDAIRTLRVTTGEMQKDIAEALQEARLAGNNSSTLSINLSNLSTSFENLADSYSANFKNLNDLVNRLLASSGGVPISVGPTFPRATSVNQAVSPQLQATLDDLDKRVDAAADRRLDDAKFAHLVGDVRALELQVTGGSAAGGPNSSFFQVQLDDLVAKIMDMESRVMDESFVIGVYSFGSYADLKKWVDKEQVPSCGVFWDLLSVLISMNPKEQTGKDRADEEYSSTRIQSTICEIDLAASMSHVKPKNLYGTSTKELGFGPTIPSHDAWIGKGMASVKKTLNTYLTDYVSGIRGHIVSTTLNGGGLADALLTQVAAQWLALTDHFGKFFDHLVDISNFSRRTAHMLVGRSSHAIWEDMRRYRSRIALLHNLNRLDNKASYIWGVLQCHRVMQDYVKLEFQSHPSFVKEMSLFMLTERVDPSQLDTLTNKVSDMTNMFDKMRKDHKALDEKYSNLKRSHDDALVVIKNLKNAKKGKQQDDTP